MLCLKSNVANIGGLAGQDQLAPTQFRNDLRTIFIESTTSPDLFSDAHNESNACKGQRSHWPSNRVHCNLPHNGFQSGRSSKESNGPLIEAPKSDRQRVLRATWADDQSAPPSYA